MNKNSAKETARIAKDVLNVANREGHLAVLAAIVSGFNTYDDIMQATDCTYLKVGDAVAAWKSVGLVESRKTGTKYRTIHPVSDAGVAGKVMELIFSHE